MDATSPLTVEQTRFAQLRQEFHALTALGTRDQQAYLEQLANTDPALHRELQALVGAFDAADLAPTELPDRRGQRIGPFELEEEIGRGGMGVVYRARRVDGAFEQQVALKLLPAGSRSRLLAQRFLRERQILARLTHPAIVRLLDGGVGSDGRPWLAMEFVDGVDLARACQLQGLDLRKRVQLLVEICAAVAHAHSRLIVHRDIKPGNILIDASGNPHLLDFGIARLDEETDGAHTVTVLQAMTPRYAAPEQLAGERATTAADIYALGVILRELTEAAPGTRDRALRQELELVVAKASAREAGMRYASVAMLADDLSDWLAARPLRSGIGSARARLAALLRQYRWPLISAVGVLLALSLGAVLTWRQAQIAERAAATANAHLEAMLNVLSAASPDVFAGREPRASEFLSEAARRLGQRFSGAPELIWRSHTQISVGLMNLNHFEAAEPLLRRALQALGETHPASPERELETLRLLVLAQRGSASAEDIRTVGARIAVLAARPDAPPGSAISALASAASSLSRLGDFPVAHTWLELAERIRRSAAQLPPDALENYWRQRGWAALRGHDLAGAESDLLASLAVINSVATQFSALRRAEAEILLAEVSLLKGDGAIATARLASAEPAYRAEYAPTHAGYSELEVLQARALLATGDVVGALKLIENADANLRAAGEEERPNNQRAHGPRLVDNDDARIASAVLAHALAANARCAEARAALERAGPQPALANRRAAWLTAAEGVGRLCP